MSDLEEERSNPDELDGGDDYGEDFEDTSNMASVSLPQGPTEDPGAEKVAYDGGADYNDDFEELEESVTTEFQRPGAVAAASTGVHNSITGLTISTRNSAVGTVTPSPKGGRYYSPPLPSSGQSSMDGGRTKVVGKGSQVLTDSRTKANVLTLVPFSAHEDYLEFTTSDAPGWDNTCDLSGRSHANDDLCVLESSATTESCDDFESTTRCSSSEQRRWKKKRCHVAFRDTVEAAPLVYESEEEEEDMDLMGQSETLNSDELEVEIDLEVDPYEKYGTMAGASSMMSQSEDQSMVCERHTLLVIEDSQVMLTDMLQDSSMGLASMQNISIMDGDVDTGPNNEASQLPKDETCGTQEVVTSNLQLVGPPVDLPIAILDGLPDISPGNPLDATNYTAPDEPPELPSPSDVSGDVPLDQPPDDPIGAVGDALLNTSLDEPDDNFPQPPTVDDEANKLLAEPCDTQSGGSSDNAPCAFPNELQDIPPDDAENITADDTRDAPPDEAPGLVTDVLLCTPPDEPLDLPIGPPADGTIEEPSDTTLGDALGAPLDGSPDSTTNGTLDATDTVVKDSPGMLSGELLDVPPDAPLNADDDEQSNASLDEWLAQMSGSAPVVPIDEPPDASIDGQDNRPGDGVPSGSLDGRSQNAKKDDPLVALQDAPESPAIMVPTVEVEAQPSVPLYVQDPLQGEPDLCGIPCCDLQAISPDIQTEQSLDGPLEGSGDSARGEQEDSSGDPLDSLLQNSVDNQPDDTSNDLSEGPSECPTEGASDVLKSKSDDEVLLMNNEGSIVESNKEDIECERQTEESAVSEDAGTVFIAADDAHETLVLDDETSPPAIIPCEATIEDPSAPPPDPLPVATDDKDPSQVTSDPLLPRVTLLKATPTVDGIPSVKTRHPPRKDITKTAASADHQPAATDNQVSRNVLTPNPIEEKRLRMVRLREQQQEESKKTREQARLKREHVLKLEQAKASKRGKKLKNRNINEKVGMSGSRAEVVHDRYYNAPVLGSPLRQCISRGTELEMLDDQDVHSIGDHIPYHIPAEHCGGHRLYGMSVTPTNPTHIKVENLRSTQADVKWSRVDNVPAEVTLIYRIFLSEDGGQTWDRIGKTEHRHWRLMGLMPNTPYYLSVTCKVESGQGRQPAAAAPGTRKRKVIHFVTHPDPNGDDGTIFVGLRSTSPPPSLPPQLPPIIHHPNRPATYTGIPMRGKQQRAMSVDSKFPKLMERFNTLGPLLAVPRHPLSAEQPTTVISPVGEEQLFAHHGSPEPRGPLRRIDMLPQKVTLRRAQPIALGGSLKYAQLLQMERRRAFA